MAGKLAKAIPKNSALFLCDMQEKFRNMISYYPQILQTSARVLQAAKVLEMPIIVTEQYPKGNLNFTEHMNISIIIMIMIIITISININ